VALDLEPGLNTAGNPRLVRAIIDEMAGGAIPFERFMALALYHPSEGYYRKPGRIGPDGDFLTSPHVHPMFGWTVAAWCREVWQRLGEPRPFTIFEPGAGDGRLADAVLDWADGRDARFRDSLEYVAIEPNARGSDDRVRWATPPIAPVEHGVVVANELFDAFPVRLLDASSRGPREVYVRWDGARFEEVAGPVVMVDGAPAAGRFEVNPHTFAAMESLCSLIRSGAVLVFDYGYPREQLWAPWRTRGTLLCFRRHTAHDDPLIHVGEQDITAHVDFDDLEAGAAAAGLETFGPRSQSDFLAALGVAQLVESARGDMEEYFRRRRAIEVITDPAGLGRIRVLVAARGLRQPPPGFEGGGPHG
jgi:SAM-dependent MidA family methyltransferase